MSVESAVSRPVAAKEESYTSEERASGSAQVTRLSKVKRDELWSECGCCVTITKGRWNTMARILVVDDVQEAVDAIRKILEKRGHEILGYTDEVAAIDHVTSHPVDLAILDIKLKKMDGVEVLGRLKEIQPDIKTIMLTGYPTHASVEEAMRLGANAYCMKPIDRGELEKKVDEVLSKGS